ncbi:pupal cuticle protein 27-like [Helicoverpa armigera]|uniref:pupal cuticle protein 27-like n=1 Tax=Helicoverpa armigera TaxID=29058 RepID=UPI00308337FA
MKLFIVLAAVTLAQAAKLDRTYLPPNAQAAAGSAFLQTPRQSNGFRDQSGAYSNPNAYAQTGAYSGFEARPERAQAAFERNAAILRQDNSNDGETYAYAYETENGISAEENGVATNGVQAQGGYSYTGDDGQVYSVRYTADENGFQPQGDHLPTPPPIPEEILKSLEINARAAAAGKSDDGSYRDASYASNNQQQYYSQNAQAPIAGVQKAYLPPFAQRNNQQPAFNNNAFARNNAGSGSSINGVQKAYLPPFAQRNNQGIRAQQPAFNRNAFARNDATGSGSSVAGVQKAYLPPFAQRNNQRSGARQSSFNARDGYRY